MIQVKSWTACFINIRCSTWHVEHAEIHLSLKKTSVGDENVVSIVFSGSYLVSLLGCNQDSSLTIATILILIQVMNKSWRLYIILIDDHSLSPGAVSLCNMFGFLGSCTFGFLGSCMFGFLGSSVLIASTSKQVGKQFGEYLFQTRHGWLLLLKHVLDFLQGQTKVAWFYYGYATNCRW